MGVKAKTNFGGFLPGPQFCSIAKNFSGHFLTREILKEAKSVSEFAGKKQVDREDVDFAVQAINEKYRLARPRRGTAQEGFLYFFGPCKREIMFEFTKKVENY